MKLQAGDTQIVVGKRVTIGAMVGSVTTVFANIYPDYAAAIVGSATAITFFIQLLVAHFASVTTKD